MNPKYNQFDFPQIKPLPWKNVFRSRTPQDAIEFISELLVYEPNRRLTAIKALGHPYFDEIKVEGCKLTSGEPVHQEIFVVTPGKHLLHH